MKKVVFVCVHNAGRSQMAEAFFNQFAKGKAKAYSAGTQPADEVNPIAAKVMKEVGIDISGAKPKMLTLEMIESADRVITMGCGDDPAGLCPARIVQTEDWALEDPKGKPVEKVREIRDTIKERVAKLVQEIIPEQEV
ncbi:MAG: arsenate reductase ArsC [Dehalococcoidales bacterium]|nr:arsenate reductase ArsC [Dehalococcoidales bacterium]